MAAPDRPRRTPTTEGSRAIGRPPLTSGVAIAVRDDVATAVVDVVVLGQKGLIVGPVVPTQIPPADEASSAVVASGPGLPAEAVSEARSGAAMAA